MSEREHHRGGERITLANEQDGGRPWQRGSNENTNGLLRQYFPKGTSLAHVTQEQLDGVADRLNGRPRQALGFHTPSEKLAEAVAMTA